MPELRLYVLPGSHPCACVEAALRLKGLDYERVDLLPLISMLNQRARFGRRTVPGLMVDGDRIVGSRLILRALDALEPKPRLLPADADRRARVEECEAWGEEVLQPLARRLSWAALRRDPGALRSYAADARLPIPLDVATTSAPLVIQVAVRVNGAHDAAARSDLAALPDHLDRVNGWIAEGLLGGRSPNVADLQICSSLRLLETIADVRPLLADRPSGRLAQRLFPSYAGEVPAGTLPQDWLPARPARAA